MSIELTIERLVIDEAILRSSDARDLETALRQELIPALSPQIGLAPASEIARALQPALRGAAASVGAGTDGRRT